MKTETIKKFRFENYYSSKTFIWTILFGVCFVIFEVLALPKSRISLAILARHFSEGNYGRLLFVLSLSIIAFVLFLSFIYAAFASSRLYRIIYFLIFSILIIVQYSYYNALAGFFGFQEAEVALYATNQEIIANAISLYFSYLSLIPIISFGVILFVTQKVLKNSWIPLFFLLFSFITFFFATTYFTKNSYYVNSFNYGIRTVITLPVIWYVGTINDTPRIRHYYFPREKVGYSSNEIPRNNIVFIIDESVRSDYLSINGHEVSTTPTLEILSEKGFIKNWGNASSGTTCSITSNALMLTGLKDLPDPDFRVYKLPTIFQYAKAMNYKAYYFDGQFSLQWNGKSSDTADFGKWITANDLKQKVKHGYDNDAEIARQVKDIVNNSKGNFIWINKFGVHKPYTNSYPPEENKTTEDSWFVDYNKDIDNEVLITQYNKAIRYNLESFFKELSNDENFGKNATYIYTSDHGQSLREEGAKASHCSNTKSEAKVPLMLLGSPENLPKVDTKFKASHSNIFATLLDLMNFPEDKRKYDYSISLLKANESDSSKRFYFVGDLNLEGEGKKYAFDK